MLLARAKDANNRVVKKYLVTKLRAMGDAVLSTATFNELKRLEPESEIHILVPKVWAPLFEAHPSVDRVWVWENPKGFWKRWMTWLQTLLALRRENFDVTLALHANGTSAWIARLCGASLRVVHNHNFFKPDRFTQRAIPQKNELKPFVERDLKALQALGLKVNVMAQTSLRVKDSEKAWAREFLFQKLGMKRPLLVVCLGASRPTKIWPMENFAEVIQDWILSRKGSVVALCSPQETAMAQSLLEKVSLDPFRVLDHLNIREMMAVLEQGDVILGNDSGPRHVAAALGRSTLTLYGPQDPYECHPYDVKKHPYLFVQGLACRSNSDPSGKYFWCGLHECHVEQHKCMKQISIAQVRQALSAIVDS